jgi:alpha-beta hydrolase superfamily lysophospholipase
MRKALTIVGGLIVIVLATAAAVLALDAPTKPPPLASISSPFAKVDFSDLPAVTTYRARDGTPLGYRAYAGGNARVVVLIHGATDDGSGMHVLAKALRDPDTSVYVPVLRGHYQSGRSGDIDYVGQLEDDLADFVPMLRARHPDASLSLIGFSSGGSFVLRVMGTPAEKSFDRFVMISPALPYDAPTIRRGGGGWVSVAIPRIVAITLLNRIGIHCFDGLPVIAFATSPSAKRLTSVYSGRLAVDFGAPRNYLAVLGRSRKPVALLAGSDDQLFHADRFAPLLKPARADLDVTIVPGVRHIGMTVAPEGVAAVRKAFLNLVAEKN